MARDRPPQSTVARLTAAFQASKYAAEANDPRVLRLAEKLDVLEATGRYAPLLASLFRANDPANIQSLLLEAVFAHQFEAAGLPLRYEVKQRTDNDTSIDFCFAMVSGKSVFIEMRLVRQRQHRTEDIAAQLTEVGSYAVAMDGEQDRDESLRLQNIILSKAQDDEGRFIKFDAEDGQGYNLIAVEVSELHLGMIDLADCRLVTYGDPAVGDMERRGIFGLFQEADVSYPGDMQRLSAKFKPFRDTIHGVLFLWKQPPGPADFELNCALICNQSILAKDEAEAIKADIHRGLAKHEHSKSNAVARER